MVLIASLTKSFNVKKQIFTIYSWIKCVTKRTRKTASSSSAANIQTLMAIIYTILYIIIYNN